MSEIIFLISESRFLMHNALKKYKGNYEELSVFNHDFEIEGLADAIIDAKTNSLFSSDKLVIVKNFDLSLLETSDEEMFCNYMNNPNPETLMIFVCKKPLDKRRKITKEIKEKTNYIELPVYKENDLRGMVVSSLGNKQIYFNDDALTEFMSRTEGNIDNIVKELEKLSLYKDPNTYVTIDDVKLLVSYDVNKKIYNLATLILNHQKEEALSLYHELRLYNDEIQLIALVSSSVRMINVVKLFKRFNLNDIELSSLIGLKNPKRLYFLKRDGKYQTKEILYKLNDLDVKIKTGQLDRRIGFELFLLGL